MMNAALRWQAYWMMLVLVSNWPRMYHGGVRGRAAVAFGLVEVRRRHRQSGSSKRSWLSASKIVDDGQSYRLN
jgi:hypothetical protein